MKTYIRAPAKINLHLEILDKRADGFHNLISLFQSVSLFDTIIVRILNKGPGCTIKGDFPFAQEQNIVKKAVDAFFQHTKQEFNLEIEIQKRIPMGAGLGGGSSNAAGVIACLTALFPDRLSEEKIKGILEDSGSDVPYFYTCAAGLVTGRGENIKPLCPRTDYCLLIIYPGFEVNTGKAYSWLDEEEDQGMKSSNNGDRGAISSRDGGTISSEFKGRNKIIRNSYTETTLAKMYLNEKAEEWGFFNSFNKVIIEKYPVIKTIISDIYTTGAFYGNITGSGSALFGLYREESTARAASGYLKSKYPFVFCAKPLDKIPLVVLK